MSLVTNLNEYKKEKNIKDLSQYKDGNYDVDKKIECITASDEDAYNMWNKIQKDKRRKGLDRIW